MERAQPIFQDRKTAISWKEASNILSPSSYEQAAVPPVKPRAEVYLFKATSDAKKNDWRCDQYRCFQNGLKSIPAKEPIVKKYYFLTQKPEGKSSDFAFFLPSDDKLVLIQYLGDEKAVSFPHGNGKMSKPYIRTCPSIILDIKSEDPAQLPSASYKKAISKSDCLPALKPVYKARNSSQIHNHRALERQKFRLSHDALYNVHEIAYDFKGYVAKMTTYPDLVLICGLTYL